MPEAKSDTITLIHFNDVYNVDSRGVEPVGGAARFLTAVKAVSRDCQPLILFSGDIFAPSISKYHSPIPSSEHVKTFYLSSQTQISASQQ